MYFSKTAAVLLLTGSLAFAQTLESGKFYVGANLGINIPSVDSRSNDAGRVTSMSLGEVGAIYDLHAGWRVYLENSFHGLEFSFKDTNGEGNYVVNSSSNLGGSFYTNESYELSYKGGYEFTPKTYVTGRFGYGRIDVDHAIRGSTEIQNGTFSNSLDLFILGLGMEYSITSNINITAEYSYRFAEDIDKRHMYLDNSGDYTDIKAEFTDHSILLGVNYIF
ncbi:outer membrane beta-barrel protein [Sulfurimonas sp.]|uniref:outer membrane protein n=1 Tax=Sulfurimonas sp. TaxID=2022749 RepID=UPI0025F080C8|nr:outer membrane beta-barrel protein [Sulfurimonas sp.]MCK9454269.1 porin family protein [Sulfurimonas sp.]